MAVFERVRRRLLNGRWISVLAVALLLLLVFYLQLKSHDIPRYWQAATLKVSQHDNLPEWSQSVDPARAQNLTASSWTWDNIRDADNFLLTQRQCEAAFPSLFDDIDLRVKRFAVPGRQISKHDVDKLEKLNGFVRAMIHDHQLYVISTGGPIYSRSFAVLAQIYRALTTSPEVVPNIEFTFSVDDWLPPLPQWAFARKPHDSTTWLMPDFGFWSWPETRVGSFAEVRTKAKDVDASLQWRDKQPRLLWRGANMSLPLRESLIKTASGKDWADVQNLDWHPEDGARVQGLISMDAHCGYKYLAHTEGNSYSGRLKYLQLCSSVIVAHPMKWLTHHSHLMKKDGLDQNYVEVHSNWADLESTILGLEENEALAQRIANNNAVTFRDRYLTPAAEVCYWRRLFRGWAEATDFEPSLYEVSANGSPKWRGVPFESYILERRLEWDPY